jgi:hypothetical protein
VFRQGMSSKTVVQSWAIEKVIQERRFVGLAALNGCHSEKTEAKQQHNSDGKEQCGNERQKNTIINRPPVRG